MDFSWTPHRFSGGALALDVANSVILRHDPDRSCDRFAVAQQLDDFAGVAPSLSAEGPQYGAMTPVQPANRQAFLHLREAIDRYYRARTLGVAERGYLATLLEATAENLRLAPSEHSLECATARSALRLITEPAPDRMKICGNCGWLFLDRSKNKSRFWCDMAVCGNRAKANRHYHRKRLEMRP